MSALRVLHVTPYFEEAWAYGGIPRVVAASAYALASRGHAVTVCTTDAGTDRGRSSVPPIVAKAVGRGSLTVRTFANVFNDAAYRWQAFLPLGLRTFLNRTAIDFDVAHLHACHNLLTVMAARACVRARVPYVISPHGTAPRIERRRAAKWLFDVTVGQGVLERATVVASVSQCESQQLIALGVHPRRIVRLDNAIDPMTFGSGGPTRQRSSDGSTVMFLGKLTPRKRIDDLIRAFAQLGDPRARLVIAGNDMGAGPRLHRLATECGVADRVSFTGLLTGEQRAVALRKADVVVYPSTDEAFGLVPLEALLAGTPVVVTNCSGSAEVIDEVGGGLSVPAQHPGLLSTAIRTILDNPSIWERAAASASKEVRRRFDPVTVCDQMESIYRVAIQQLRE